jgi:predicted nucleic acid-binding protein
LKPCLSTLAALVPTDGIYAVVDGTGRKPRGGRAVDLMIAATALAHDLPLYTRNAKGLRGLEGLIEIVDVGA